MGSTSGASDTESVITSQAKPKTRREGLYS
jgi:hypothetical protein